MTMANDAVTGLENIRKDFPMLALGRNGKLPVYLDSACTSLVPIQVIESINHAYHVFPTCSGDRSTHWLSEAISLRIEGNAEKGVKGARQKIQEFINAASPKDIIFTANTSHAINLVALGFPFQSGQVVLQTDREHNSNLLPWLRLQRSGRVKVQQISMDDAGGFDLNGFRQQLASGRIGLVSMGYTSNLTGATIPAREVIRLAHQYDVKVLLDAAQTVPHRAIDVQDLDVDFMAFSLHKMCGPKGVGVLYAKDASLESGEVSGEYSDKPLASVLLGGGTVSDATYSSYRLLASPERFEVGVQNYPGLIAAGTAVDYLQRIGMDLIREHETRLNSYLTQRLLDRYGGKGWFRILGPGDPARRAGILTFEVQRPNAVDIARELSEKSNVMIRSGAFCVHSYLNKRFGAGWARPAMPAEHRMTYRLSLYFYNTEHECRVFLQALDEIFQERCYV